MRRAPSTLLRTPALLLLLATFILSCTTPVTKNSSTPTSTATSSIPSATPTPGLTAPAVAQATPAPVSTPGVTHCPTVEAGDKSLNRVVADVRAARQTDHDRVTFDLGPGGMPPYSIEQVARVVEGGSGFPKTVQGNFYILVRFQQAGMMAEYKGPRRLLPDTKNVREILQSEDFEGVLAFAIGLDTLVCPSVAVLADPARLVLSFK